jgi:DUF971 family protein
MSIKPDKINVSRSQKLMVIHWDDGHRSEYPLARLRNACPCAECRNKEESERQIFSTEGLGLPIISTQSFQIESLNPVGNYALQLTWKDGHRFGIYPWQYLRELCPCDEHGLKDGLNGSTTR